ncbi:MAG: antitoxin [Meiothermus sp.]
MAVIDQKQREQAAENALASLRIEGLEPDAETQADMERWTRGEISLEEVRKRAVERLTQPKQ